MPGRTHRSAPTRGGRYSEPTENWCEDRPCQRGGTEPAPYGSSRAGRSTAGCGHPAVRERHRWCAATGRCGHRPLQEEGEASATTQASGTERIVHAAVARDGWNSEQKASPKCPATSDNPSVSLRLTAPFTQGSLSLRGTGEADCRVGPVGLLAMTAVFCHSEERSDVGIRPFYDGRGSGRPTNDEGNGTPSRRALRKAQSITRASGAQRSVCASGCEGWTGIGARTIPKGGPPPRSPGQRLAKRKARKEQLVKFDFCPITSECSTAYNVRKSQ